MELKDGSRRPEMFEVSIQEHFDAAHYLRGYQGRCENLHGHRFEVMVSVKVKVLDNIGLAYDFTELKAKLREILGRFDHTSLNDITPFDQINPSSENIAATIYTELRTLFGGEKVAVSSIKVWESPHSCITYFPEKR
jgi:6-pyruvoyltetrahydropterin/6-carboxytetrahydropterin synthase